MWSEPQRKLFLRASGIAGWNDQLRYVAMRACGCPLVKGTVGRGQATPGGDIVSRPSIKSPGNTHEQFGAVMMLAESAAKTRGTGAQFPRPRGFDSWTEASFDTSNRVRHLARRVWAEAREKMPGVFTSGEAGIDTFVKNQLAKDPADFPGFFDVAPENLDECDLAQATRILESLKAWIGRRFYEAGIRPQSFSIPGSAVAQVKAQLNRRLGRDQVAGKEITS